MKSKELGAKKGVVLNKTYVENAAVGEHRDERTLGFCLRVTDRGKKTFYVHARIRGTNSNKTKKIGNYPDTLCEQAREQAIDVLRSLHNGIDPDAEEKAQAAKLQKEALERAAAEVTLGQAFERYMETKAAKHSVQTKRVYRCEMKHFADWSELPITSITLAAPDKSKGRLDPLASLIRARDEELVLLEAILLQHLRPTGP